MLGRIENLTGLSENERLKRLTLHRDMAANGIENDDGTRLQLENRVRLDPNANVDKITWEPAGYDGYGIIFEGNHLVIHGWDEGEPESWSILLHAPNTELRLRFEQGICKLDEIDGCRIAEGDDEKLLGIDEKKTSQYSNESKKYENERKEWNAFGQRFRRLVGSKLEGLEYVEPQMPEAPKTKSIPLTTVNVLLQKIAEGMQRGIRMIEARTTEKK